MILDLSQLWVFGLLVVLVALIGAVALGLSLFARLAERSTYQLDDILINYLRQPLQFLLPVLLALSSPRIGRAAFPSGRNHCRDTESADGDVDRLVSDTFCVGR